MYYTYMYVYVQMICTHLPVSNGACCEGRYLVN